MNSLDNYQLPEQIGADVNEQSFENEEAFIEDIIEAEWSGSSGDEDDDQVGNLS